MMAEDPAETWVSEGWTASTFFAGDAQL